MTSVHFLHSPACSAAQPFFFFLLGPIQHSRSSGTITRWQTLWWLLIPPQFSCLENPNPPASLKHLHVAAGNCPPVLRAPLPRPVLSSLPLSYPRPHPPPAESPLHGMTAFSFRLLLVTGSDTSRCENSALGDFWKVP